jgi:uncharacterized protein
MKIFIKKILIPICILIPTICFAASFDCTKAKTPVEKAICTNQELSSLDDKLNTTYKSIKEIYSNDFFKKYIQKNQVEWIKSLKIKCTKDIAECLINEYKKRIDALQVATQKNKGYLIYEGKIDSSDDFFKEINQKGKIRIISENLFYIENVIFSDDPARPNCYEQNSFYRKSDKKALSNGDLFLMNSVDKFSIELANNFINEISNKDRFTDENITKKELIEDIKDKLNNGLNEFSITKDNFTIHHILSRGNECVYLGMETKTKNIKNYLTPFFIKELGL